MAAWTRPRLRVGDTVRRPAGDWTPTVHACSAPGGQGFPRPGTRLATRAARTDLSAWRGGAGRGPRSADRRRAAQVGVLLSVSQRGGDFGTALPRHLAMGRSRCWRARSSARRLWPYNLICTGPIHRRHRFELAVPASRWRASVFAAIRVAHLRPDDMRRADSRQFPDRAARLAAFAFAYGCDIRESCNAPGA